MREKKTALLLIISLFFLYNIFSQNRTNNFDFRSGIGISLLSISNPLIIIENEVNYNLNKYFSNSFSLNIGRDISNQVYNTSYFLQGNLNIFFSIFSNNEKNDLRIGTGISLNNISEITTVIKDIDIENPFRKDIPIYYGKVSRNEIGYNFILEKSYSILNNYLISFKIFTQRFASRTTNTGFLIKFGIKLKNRTSANK